ncbi:MAG: MMPL family transporter, partial [Planctomycetota bacterium]
MTRAFQRATNWIVDWPALTVLIIVLLTGAAITGYVAPEKILDWIRPELDEQQEQRVQVDRDSNEEPPDVNPFSISNANAILVAESSQFFTPDGSRMLRNVVEKLEALPYVSSVVWMDRVPPSNIFGLPEPLVPNATASQARFDNARKKALANPLVRGQFLSQDGRTTVMLLRFDFFYVESNEDCVSGIREVAEAAAAEVSNTDVEFSVTGRTPLYIAARQQYNRSAAYYQIIGYSVIAIMALILFRGFAAVLIVAVAPALGVFWTLGLLPYFDLQDNPFKEVLLPVLISLVGLTDGVHLMVHIRRLRADGLSTIDAARQGVHEVGLACGLTSLTTAIGFGSLVLATHEIVREFGWCCVVGVTMTFISVITTIPLLCSSWLGRNVHKGLD